MLALALLALGASGWRERERKHSTRSLDGQFSKGAGKGRTPAVQDSPGSLSVILPDSFVRLAWRRGFMPNWRSFAQILQDVAQYFGWTRQQVQERIFG